MSGYDAGYIYEYNINTGKCFGATMIYEGDDKEIRTRCY